MEDLLQRVTFDQDVLRGRPVIRGMCVSVEMILELLAKGATRQEILEDYPVLEPEDIQAALTYDYARGGVPAADVSAVPLSGATSACRGAQSKGRGSM